MNVTKVTDDSYVCVWTTVLQFLWNGTMLQTDVTHYSYFKVRPHGQKFSRTTWYNMVVRHKPCRGSVDGMGDVCRATFYILRSRL